MGRKAIYVGISFGLILALVRWFYPERSINYAGPLALLDCFFALGLLLIVLLVGTALGLKILRLLGLEGLSGLERAIFSMPLGLGILAYGVLLLGLLGLLRAEALFAWLVLAGVLSWKEWRDILRRLPGALITGLGSWEGLGFERKLLVYAGGIILLLTLLQALTPPWDADGLLYHLQVPRLFLDAGRISSLPDNWLTYYPFTVEMLFALGLGFGSDNFAKLVHLTFAIILVLGTYACGRRYLGDLAGWFAAAVLLGIPIFPIWASIAYIDIAWAVYEFLAVYALLVWSRDRQPAWLILAGMLMGFGLGSKYLAIGGAVAVGLWVLWQGRSLGWRGSLKGALLFGGLALMVASPWYLKNWLWTGNPVYPLIFSSQGWDVGRLTLWNSYMRSFGTGRSLVDYLFLPLSLYFRYEQFGTFLGSIEVPSYLFLLLVFYPWTDKSNIIPSLFWLLCLRFVVWALGTQQTRYLLPLFPVLSLLTSHVLVWIMEKLSGSDILRGNMGRILVNGLVLGMVGATVVYSILYLILVRPAGVVIGAESKDNFLRRLVEDYPAIQFVQSELEPQSRVLMLWDGRAYYCDERCIPDVDHTQWTQLVSQTQDVMEVAYSLKEIGVTHLLLSVSDLDFILQHDPTEEHYRAASFFLHQFHPACAREVYNDDNSSILELTCP
jgi:hypothetical protein